MHRKAQFFFAALALSLTPQYAAAHVGAGTTASFAAGFGHPFAGLDHIAVMVAVGLWAALKGGRALWLWPLAFVTLMIGGAVLGFSHVALPFVEPAILASVVAIGLLVALAVNCPLWLGAAVIGAFAVFHGHAHGSELPQGANGLNYLAGFVSATAMLHLFGLGLALACLRGRQPMLIRAAGAACVVLGVLLGTGIL